MVAAAVVGLLAVGGAGSAAIGHALSDAGGHDGRGTVGDVRGGHRHDGDRAGDGPAAPAAPPAAGTGTTTS